MGNLWRKHLSQYCKLRSPKSRCRHPVKANLPCYKVAKGITQGEEGSMCKLKFLFPFLKDHLTCLGHIYETLCCIPISIKNTLPNKQKNTRLIMEALSLWPYLTLIVSQKASSPNTTNIRLWEVCFQYRNFSEIHPNHNIDLVLFSFIIFQNILHCITYY